MRIDNQVLAVLGAARVEGNQLFLTGQLDRNLYQRTDKVLQAAGGKWNRSKKAHVFESCAESRIEQMINTGDIVVPQDFGYFPTPKPVVELLVELAELKNGHMVLEPSAGQGAIVEGILDAYPNALVDLYELLQVNCDAIFKKNFRLSGGGVFPTDFLAVEPNPIYDRVVMNPPFEKQADIKHVLHAFKFLKPGGRLVSVMSAAVQFRDNNLTKDFRRFVAEKGGTIQELPQGSFKVSGTMVNTVVVTIPN